MLSLRSMLLLLLQLPPRMSQWHGCCMHVRTGTVLTHDWPLVGRQAARLCHGVDFGPAMLLPWPTSAVLLAHPVVRIARADGAAAPSDVGTSLLLLRMRRRLCVRAQWCGRQHERWCSSAAVGPLPLRCMAWDFCRAP